MSQEDDELEFETGSTNRFGKLYIFKVLKEYGIFYALMLLVFSLCYFLVIIPATAIYLFKGLVFLINYLSNGNELLLVTYWYILIGGLVVAATCWVTDKVIERKRMRRRNRSHNNI